MVDSLFQQIEQLINDGAAPGCAVALFADGKTRSFACGRYGDTISPAVTAQTIYDLASVTKLFTAAIVIRLHEAGKLSIYDRAGDYLPNFHASGLQLIDLLTHRVDFGFGMSEYRAKYPTAEVLYNALTHVTPPARAAAGVTYANTGPFFLGLAAERVSGRTLGDLMHELFADLELQHTCTGPDIARQHIETPPTEMVDGRTIQGVTHDETARLLGGLTGHAGVFSTAEDLVRFGRAWLNGKIVKTETLRRAVFHDYDLSGRNPQALGWWLRYPAPSGRGYRKTPGIYSHAGFTGPMLAIHPANSKVAAIVCNRTYYGRENRKQRAVWELLINWLEQPHGAQHG